MKNFYLLFLVGLLFAGCKKSDTSTLTPKAGDYFVEYALDGQKVTLTRSALISDGTGVNETLITGDNGTGATYIQIRLFILGQMNGKPGTLKIRAGDIIKSESEGMFFTDNAPSEVGSVTFTEVTDQYAVGTFTLNNVIRNGKSLKVTDGKFRVMFYKRG